jgi:uncharacterized protein (DUF4415 family)
MNESNPSTRLDSADDAPDLSTPEWQEAFARVEVRRGRPKAEKPKVSTTLRIDSDILAFFRSGGPGWQTRINETLRAAIMKPKSMKASRGKARRTVARAPDKNRA